MGKKASPCSCQTAQRSLKPVLSASQGCCTPRATQQSPLGPSKLPHPFQRESHRGSRIPNHVPDEHKEKRTPFSKQKLTLKTRNPKGGFSYHQSLVSSPRTSLCKPSEGSTSLSSQKPGNGLWGYAYAPRSAPPSPTPPALCHTDLTRKKTHMHQNSNDVKTYCKLGIQFY